VRICVGEVSKEAQGEDSPAAGAVSSERWQAVQSGEMREEEEALPR